MRMCKIAKGCRNYPTLVLLLSQSNLLCQQCIGPFILMIPYSFIYFSGIGSGQPESWCSWFDIRWVYSGWSGCPYSTEFGRWSSQGSTGVSKYLNDSSFCPHVCFFFFHVIISVFTLNLCWYPKSAHILAEFRPLHNVEFILSVEHCCHFSFVV